MNSQIFFLIVLFLLICLAFALTPYLTRKTENFGVSIPESLYDRKDFKGMRKKYTTSLLIIGILFSAGLFLFGFDTESKYADNHLYNNCICLYHIRLSNLSPLP